MLETGKGTAGSYGQLPKWVPQEAKRYLAHTESGDTIRELARRGGCAPSTVMRQVRKLEQKRDDPLIDEALSSLSRLTPQARDAAALPLSQNAQAQTSKDIKDKDFMTDQSPFSEPTGATPPDDATIAREARRILRRLSEPGACLAVAKDMEKAVVVRDLPDGRTARTAVLDRPIAQAMALKDWIVANAKGKITRYTITAAGRAALRGFLAEDESARAGFAEAPARFDAGAGGFALRADADTEDRPKRIRYNAAESPVMVLSRRRDKDGTMFLPPELVAAAERLREDFELAQMGAGGVNWERFPIEAGRVTGDVNGFGSEAAKARVAAALGDLGPGLGDVALRCCCFLEGMEQAEKRMGWSARSGKIVLRIALQRLKKHYDEAGYSNLIG
ncbi:DUF6456 domain-containing protein [Celeribacter sp. SCSIO 80788]|uniref:DUF6456 domain-containing protein n=1 Tax=Celeribacter sp. SCSIO 80788 TaxID=3117013 RepID=UPI003DA39454